MTTEYLDRMEPGWFALDVMKAKARGRDWVALLIDIDPDELENCECDFPAKFYVHPKDYKPGVRKARQAWFRLPGKYRNKDAAWDALHEMMVVRH
jgi:hypothetical protein